VRKRPGEFAVYWLVSTITSIETSDVCGVVGVLIDFCMFTRISNDDAHQSVTQMTLSYLQATYTREQADNAGIDRRSRRGASH
jgi:hypothetical protein